MNRMEWMCYMDWNRLIGWLGRDRWIGWDISVRWIGWDKWNRWIWWDKRYDGLDGMIDGLNGLDYDKLDE